MSDCKPVPAPIVKDSEKQPTGKAESSRDLQRNCVSCITETRPSVVYSACKASHTLEALLMTTS